MTAGRRFAIVVLATAVFASLSIEPPTGKAAPATREAPTVRSLDAPGLIRTVELVVDISGSMNDQDGAGTVKLNGAKAGIIALLAALPANVDVGLRTYPANGANCGPGTLVADVQSNRGVISREVRNLKADGGTPTDEALEAAYEDLASLGRTKNASIVLVSDGESNCNRKPCDVAKEIAAKGLSITVNTIGFRISASGAAELACIADATGGQYVDAQDADELSVSLGALAGAALNLSAEAPRVVARSVGMTDSTGIVESPKVSIVATVANPSTNLAARVRVQITATSDQRPFLLDPVKQIGNLDPSDRRTVGWSFAATAGFHRCRPEVQDHRDITERIARHDERHDLVARLHLPRRRRTVARRQEECRHSR